MMLSVMQNSKLCFVNTIELKEPVNQGAVDDAEGDAQHHQVEAESIDPERVSDFQPVVQ